MLRLVNKRGEIANAQREFGKKMDSMTDRRGEVLIGWKGGNRKLHISWSNELGIWWILSQDAGNRYWNAFGTGKPRWTGKHSHSIDCEINIPYVGMNRTIAGAFANDDEGNIYLVHRGRVGGGKKGIGKTKFLQNFRGEWGEVSHGGSTQKFALVGALASERFQRQVADFVREVRRIKNVPSVTKSSRFALADFKKEFFGTRKIVTSREIEAKCDHGLVVNALAEKLRLRGLDVGNRDFMDLYILSTHEDIEILFEIKTDATRASCYEAIGQLFFHSCSLGKSPRLVTVFPDTLDRKCMQVLRRLKIGCITYAWSGRYPIFDTSFRQFSKSLGSED